MACEFCDAAHQALLDQIVEQKVELEELKELVELLVETVQEHDEDLELLLEEEEVFESEDEADYDE
jgi:hypothetical protein